MAAFDEVIKVAVKRSHEPQQVVGDLLEAEIAEKQGEHPVRAALRRGVLRAENSAYGQSYAQCLRAA